MAYENNSTKTMVRLPTDDRLEKKIQMSESKLESQIVTLCSKLGLLTYKFSSPSQRGVPDRVIMGRGRVLFLELKNAGCKPTGLQERELERIKNVGISAGWADNYKDADLMIRHKFHHPLESTCY